MTTIELLRAVPLTITRDEGTEGDGLTLDGLATPFGRDLKAGEDPSEGAGWTFIASWEGEFWERFTPGAFKKTLRERTPMMQYDHGRHPLLGSLPIGTYSLLEETDEGVHVVGRLSDNWLVEPVRDAIRDGGVSGMSIRFAPVRDVWQDSDGKTVKGDELMELLWSGGGGRGPLRRSISEAKLLEAGPVAWPAYSQTSVGVRAREAAEVIRSKEPLRRDVQQALALGRPSQVAKSVPEDMRHEVALALLLRTAPEPEALGVAVKPASLPEDMRSALARALNLPLDSERSTVPSEGAPVATKSTPAEPAGDETRNTDAPPAGAPVTPAVNDAPPVAGHPSEEQQQRRQYQRLAYLTLNRVGKKR